MEGFDIPLGADFSAMQAAFDSVIAAVDKMGDKIVAALEKSSAAALHATASMGKLHAGSAALSNAANQAGNSASTAAQKFVRAASTAGSLGNAVSGAAAGIKLVSSASRVLAGINLATQMSAWMRSSGGLRTALAAIPGTLRAIASNRTFQVIAVSAAAAYAAILTVRTAFRLVSAATSMLKSAAAATFHGMVSAARTAGRAVSGAFQGIASLPGKVMGAIPGLPIAGILSAAGAIALLVTQLKGASGDAAVFEDMQVSVEHFTGSVKSAKRLLEDLEKFSIKTPFETNTIQQTAKGLLGAGIRKDVAGITKDLSALAGSGEELGELGDAIGKGFAKGKFQTEEMNKFLERGINLIPALNAAVGLSGAAFQKAMEKGLSFGQVTKAIHAMSQAGGQFFGLLEKRSLTFSGLVSTLQSAWTNLRKAFAAPINDALKPILQAGIDNLTGLMKKAEELGKSVGNAISLVFTAFQDGKLLALLGSGMNVAFEGAVDILTRGFRSAVGFLATALPPIVEGAFAKMQDPKFWQGISNVFQAMGMGFSAEIKAAIPFANMQEVAELRQKAALYQDLGGMQMQIAGHVDMAEVLSKALSEGLAQAKVAAGGANSAGYEKALDDWNKAIRKLQSKVDADNIFGELLNRKGGTATATPPSVTDNVTKAVAPAVMSLTRIGGGGFSNTVLHNQLAEARKQTGVLNKILTAVSSPVAKKTAAYS